MKVNVLRQPDDYLLNVRHTDEIAEQYGMTDAEAAHMENQLKTSGRFWINADILLMPRVLS